MSDYNQWEQIYSYHLLEEFQWEIGEPRKILVDLVESGLIKKGKALDTCCGVGINAFYLAKNGFDVTGIDISPTAIEFGKKKAEEAKIKIKLEEQNYLKLPFKNEEFDFIFDMGCFYHVRPEDRTTFINQIDRVLKQGGLYLLVAFSHKNGSDWNHFTLRQLTSSFSDHFKIKLIKHFPSVEGDGLTRYFYALLLEKK